MKVAAYVPIKLNNERAPGKNIKRFDDGTPLCQFMFNTISKVEEINNIYCFCSSEEIIPYLSGRVSFLKRDKCLDSNKAKFQDICDSFIDNIDSDIIVLAHVTSPFLNDDSIRECVNAVISGKYDSAFTATKVQDFLWQNGKPLNFKPESIVRTQDLPAIYKESVGCYVFKKEIYKELKRRIGLNPYICEVSKIEAIDIDYMEDFDIANAIYINMKEKSKGSN